VWGFLSSGDRINCVDLYEGALQRKPIPYGIVLKFL